MNGLCACCGNTGPIELHHIGRRKYSKLTIHVCPGCHRYLTVTDVQERRWASAHPADHIAFGLLDILARFADSLGLHDWSALARHVSRIAGDFGGFSYKPSAALADDPVMNWSSLTERLFLLGATMFAFGRMCEAYRES